ncbi:small nuclear ribonucleoprotein polypeptide A [Gamsiella multidivaricata]|uniref:small nuclear ribonucleoprotein polypeptide A n=1 Tax=Gamsiella multidivaricata TaxID=101098 RepID=UPI0022206C30|nr:small nuclear ribonucleoprotein polypeptide A [Gamsiella multidivaricata]KAI7832316.1 small nuclear ribonucleoprotein polypeptide A [Gamsiella multidivaricata]
MKLTPELISRAPCYLNAVQDRELDLRSHKIPAIENLGVTKDLNDSLDLTDNDIRSLSNFPSLPRLKCLLLSNNRISRIDPNLSQYLPNLTTVVLTNNAITELSDLDGLAGCKALEILSLLDNPIIKKKYYREWVIWKLPNVRVLDFERVKQKERQEAKKLFEGKAGPSALAESIAATKSSTFEPGEGVPLPLKSSVPTLNMSKEDQDKIKAALAKVTTLDETAKLERALKEGKIPGYLKDQDSTNGSKAKKQRLSTDEGKQEEEKEDQDTEMQ